MIEYARSIATASMLMNVCPLIGVSGYVDCIAVNQIGGVGRYTAVPRAAGHLLEALDTFASCYYKLLCLFGGDVVFHCFSRFVAPITSCAG